MALLLIERPWALLDRTGRRARTLIPAAVPLRDEGFGALWLHAPAGEDPTIGGRTRGSWPEITLEKGMAIFALPVPERAADGLLFRTSDGVVRVKRAHIPGRPIEDAERTSGEQEEAAALFDRVKSVWARLREVEDAMDDPAHIWEKLAEAWLGAEEVPDPEMDRIVRHARELVPTLDLLDRAPRRILRRTQRMIPLSRVQEMDRKSMAWLIRQPGETMAERAGDRQRVRAVAREENFDTLENRVVLSYAVLARAVARAYGERHRAAKNTARVRRVADYGVRCQALERSFHARRVFAASADITPNFVLQNNPLYHRVWEAWQDLLRRGRILDQLWRWQARSWEEFCALAVVVALQSLAGARSIAVSPLLFRDEQQGGCWISHVNPLAVIHLPHDGATVELSYRMRAGSLLSPFGAPVWLRYGRMDRGQFPSRWAVWPLWDARGGLTDGEAVEVAALREAGRREGVRGGITIRPTRKGEAPTAVVVPGGICLTLGAAGAPLKAGIEQLAAVLRDHVLGSGD